MWLFTLLEHFSPQHQVDFEEYHSTTDIKIFCGNNSLFRRLDFIDSREKNFRMKISPSNSRQKAFLGGSHAARLKANVEWFLSNSEFQGRNDMPFDDLVSNQSRGIGNICQASVPKRKTKRWLLNWWRFVASKNPIRGFEKQKYKCSPIRIEFFRRCLKVGHWQVKW